MILKLTKERIERINRALEGTLTDNDLFLAESLDDALKDRSALLAALAERDAEIRSRDAELLRIRTTQAGAAHAIDNLGIELGLGHSATPEAVTNAVRGLRSSIAEREAEVERMRKEFGAIADLMEPTLIDDPGHDEVRAFDEGIFRLRAAASADGGKGSEVENG